MTNRLKCVFMGTPEFCLPTLQVLKDHSDIELCSIVSMPDKKSGRGQKLQSPAVINFAKEHGLPFFQTQNINKEEQFLDDLKDKKVDLIIVLAFAQFLGERILKLPTLGCFNIHTSLLPAYRGAAPIQYALLNGDQITGVTIQEMVKKMDAGDIVWQDQVEILKTETGESLNSKLSLQAAQSTSDFITAVKNNRLKRTPQKHEQATFAPTLDRSMGKIDFSKDNALNIERKVRALYPWPGTFCFLDSKRLKLHEVSFSEEQLAPGQTLVTKPGELHVGTQKGSLRLHYIQLEGRTPCTDTDLLRAHQNKTQIQLRPEVKK